jgi:hypothetical protein
MAGLDPRLSGSTSEIVSFKLKPLNRVMAVLITAIHV